MSLYDDDELTLIYYTKKGNVEAIINILISNISCINDQDEVGNTALIIASWSEIGHEIVDILLNNKCNINIKNNDGLTAMMVSARDGHIASLSLLINAGADDKITCNKGLNALLYAKQQDQILCIRQLESYKKCNRNNTSLPTPPPSMPKVIDNTHSSPLLNKYIPSFISLKNCVAIISGCGNQNGIGFAIAEAYLELDCSILITSTTNRIFERMQELKIKFPNSKIIASFGDLTQEVYADSVAKLAIDNYGFINILVNNAGMTTISNSNIEFESGGFFSSNISYEGWKLSLSRNLDTIFLLTKAVYPYIRLPHSNGVGGRIINISSTTGPVNATKDECGYATAKAGIIGFTKSLAIDGSTYGITTNAIAPGFIATTSQSDYEAEQGLLCPLNRSGLGKKIIHNIYN
jgi:3-oxoacyl-[acyl-carrier protein] reductase